MKIIARVAHRYVWQLFVLGVLTGLLPFAVQAQQVDLGVAAQYSGFFFGNAGNIHNIDGRLAVGGNLSIGGYNIAGRVSTDLSQPALVVGGDLTITGGGRIQGGAGHDGYGVYGGQLILRTPSTDDFRKVSSSPVDFEAERINLSMLSGELRDTPATGSVSVSRSKVTLTGSNQDVEIFNLRADQVGRSMQFVLVNVKAGASLVLNITSDQQRHIEIGIGMNAFKDRNLQVLFNLHDADVLTIQGGLVLGSILAPFACVPDGNGQVEGTIVAVSWGTNIKTDTGTSLPDCTTCTPGVCTNGASDFPDCTASTIPTPPAPDCAPVPGPLSGGPDTFPFWCQGQYGRPAGKLGDEFRVLICGTGASGCHCGQFTSVCTSSGWRR